MGGTSKSPAAWLAGSAPWLAAILVPLGYLLFYTPYGMDTTDFGYFYGYAWRILEGQAPYRDFSYIKPALPLYWHAMWMWLTPEKWQILGGKAGFLLSILASSWLGAIYFGKLFNLRAMALPLPLLATCGFVFAAHNFPHMPWHTADGALFCSGALLAAATGWNALAGVLAIAATLCKQSFLLVPFGILIFLLVKSRNGACVFALACAVCLALAWAWLIHIGAWHQFRAMTTGQLDIHEALDAGIFIYLRQNWLIPLAALIPWVLGRLAGWRLPNALKPPYCYLGILTAWYIAEALRTKGWIGFGASWPTLFLLLGCVCVLWPGKFLRPWLRCPEMKGALWQGALGLACALLAAWSIAISGGYKIPALFAIPGIFSFFLFQPLWNGSARALAWTTFAAGLLMFGVGWQYPYVFPARPLMLSDLAHDAGQVYPRASGVKVDGDMLERLAELRELRAKYGPAYKTLPGFSLAYFLNGDYPLYGSDWLIDWEINGEVDRLYQELLDKNITVFMERDQLDAERADAYARAGYGVPQRVRKNWRIVEETPHFVVFQPPTARMGRAGAGAPGPDAGTGAGDIDYD